MKIIETADRTPTLLRQLLEVWERSVRATHLFLSDGEIRQIKQYVPQALGGIEHLIIAEDEAGRPAAFMGIENYGIERLTVNEQNPQARGFYEHMGFQVYRRTDHDEQGNPYPILYMRR